MAMKSIRHWRDYVRFAMRAFYRPHQNFPAGCSKYAVAQAWAQKPRLVVVGIGADTALACPRWSSAQSVVPAAAPAQRVGPAPYPCKMEDAVPNVNGCAVARLMPQPGRSKQSHARRHPRPPG